MDETDLLMEIHILEQVLLIYTQISLFPHLYIDTSIPCRISLFYLKGPSDRWRYQSFASTGGLGKIKDGTKDWPSISVLILQ